MSLTSPRRESRRSLSHRVRVTLATTAVVGALAVSGLVGSPAQAGPNHHGTEPVASGCANGAYTIATRKMPYRNMTLEVRYSPACATNWIRIPQMYGGVRFYLASDAMGPSIAVTQSGSHWTNQVYAPGSTCIGFQATSVNDNIPIGARIC